MKYSIYMSYLCLLGTFSFLSCTSTTQKGVDLNPTEFKAAIENESNAVILDVRTPEEMAQGIIPGAKNIDFRGDNFKAKLAQLDKDKTYYVYCRSGGRSGKTCNALQTAGFLNIYNLKGGITAWKEAGLETVQQ